MVNLKKEIIQSVVEYVDMDKEITDESLLDIIDKIIMEKSREIYITMDEKREIKRDIFNSIRRLDVLQDLVDDPSITEIMINGSKSIFIEQKGMINLIDKKFQSETKLEDVIQQIVSRANRVINEASPIVDARLADGSRVNVVLPPVSLDGPVVTIRKFPESPITMKELIKYNSITSEVANFLEQLVIAKYNIFISGGTGSGKTTFLNVLSNFIPNNERIITIEDSAELQIRNIPNIVRLEVRNANVQGSNEISIRDLIKTSLRMRPDRIIIGEIRDGAAIDMLQAFNTGHSGSLSTGHANSALDMLSRLETLVLMGAEIPLIAIRQQIASAIDIVIHLGRLRDSSRRVMDIIEIIGFEGGEIKVNSLYEFIERGEEDGKVIGELEKTENILERQDKLHRAGIKYYD